MEVEKMKDDPLNRLKVKRGQDLPQSKITDADVLKIRAIVDKRDELKAELKTMSNKAIAIGLGVHYRTIDRITAFENWTHV